MISHNARITRELNNIHLEQEQSQADGAGRATNEQQEKIDDCLKWFQKNLELLQRLNPELQPKSEGSEADYRSPVDLTQHQVHYLDKLLYELKVMHRDLEDLNAHWTP